MTDTVKQHIQSLVDLETKGWNTKNTDLFLSMIHPDMAWPWPPTADAHDPVEWVFVLGRFDMPYTGPFSEYGAIGRAEAAYFQIAQVDCVHRSGRKETNDGIHDSRGE